jgi:hypothetical protein
VKTFYDCLQDPEEQPFVAALLNDSTNPTLRDRYAELLERRGDPRAPALRAANMFLAGVADSAERARLTAEVDAARQEVDEFLSAVLFSPMPIKNCGQRLGDEPRLRFSFRCPQTWGDLRPTDEDKVRFCEVCSTPVQRCSTLAEAERHALLGGCISVDGAVMREADARYTRAVTGRPDIVAMWADRLFAPK